MIMPFIRLIAIYVVVIVAVTAFFKRDQISEITGLSVAWPWSQSSPESGTESGTSTNTTPAPASKVPASTPESVASVTTTPVAPIQTPVSDAATQTETQPETQQPQPAPLPIVQPTATQPKPVTPAPVAQPTPATPAPAPTTQPTADDLQTRLAKARRAYWAGDMANAEMLFVALRRDAPTNADVNGELGNILYAQRRYGEAADAFLAAGKLLVKQGNRAQVLPLINVLQSIAPDKAAALRALAAN